MREREAHQWSVSRSDGKTQPRSIKSATGVRAPVPLEDPAYERWEFLAGNALRDMLYQQGDPLAGSDFFVEFPGNYEIYFEARAGKKDYYLYGHPSGDSYKAARDFVPHLFWLTTGSADLRDCLCTLCKRSVTEHARASSSGAPRRKKSTTAKTASAAAITNTTSTPNTSINTSSVTPVPAPAIPVAPAAAAAAAAAAAPVSANPPSTTSVTLPTTQASAAAPAPAAATASPPPVPAASATASHSVTTQEPVIQQEMKPSTTPSAVPTASAPPTSSSAPAPPQRPMMPQETIIFRDGEVVWFKNGLSWRLGIILRTIMQQTPTGMRPQCIVKPLAHSAIQTPVAAKAEEEMRPFLAFSVPQVSPSLNHFQGQPLQRIDWEAQQTQIAGNDQGRRDMLGMEVSKMAVIIVNDSYSTFNRQRVPEPTPTRAFYGGLFLGAERLTAGEAVRIRHQAHDKANPLSTIVLTIKAMFVDSTSGQEVLYFYGDILQLKEVPANSPPPEYTANVPQALAREKAFRDRIRARAGVRYDWVPVPGTSQNVMVQEKDIRGRFYETDRLMNILDPQSFQAACAKGEIIDAQSFLNNRIEPARQLLGRKKNRSEAVMGAMPADNLPLVLGTNVIED